MENSYFDPIEIKSWTCSARSYSAVRQCKQIGRRKQAEDILLSKGQLNEY